MYKIICDNCKAIIGSSSRKINEEYKEERWNKAMHIHITCKRCLNKRIIDMFRESTVSTGTRRKRNDCYR